MNGNVIKSLLKDPEFIKKYDAVKGIDLYSDNKIVYAVFDKNNIKILNENAETTKPITKPLPENVAAPEKPTTETPVQESTSGTGQPDGEATTPIQRLTEAKEKEIAEAEKPPIDIDFNLKDADFLKSEKPIELKRDYIELKKDMAMLKKLIKDCL